MFVFVLKSVGCRENGLGSIPMRKVLSLHRDSFPYLENERKEKMIPNASNVCFSKCGISSLALSEGLQVWYFASQGF